MNAGYHVETARVSPLHLAAIRTRLDLDRLPQQIREHFDELYAWISANRVSHLGTNVIVYDAFAPAAPVTFGVAVPDPVSGCDEVEPAQTPSGESAHAVHYGPYDLLGEAHRAVEAWCRARGLTRHGVTWEVYGHWEEDEAKRRTDVYALLAP